MLRWTHFAAGLVDDGKPSESLQNVYLHVLWVLTSVLTNPGTCFIYTGLPVYER